MYLVVNRYSDEFRRYSNLANAGPFDTPEAKAMAVAVFKETQQQHQLLIRESGILSTIITDESVSTIGRLCAYRAACRVSGRLMVSGGVKVIERPFLDTTDRCPDDTPADAAVGTFLLQPRAREQRIPVYSTGVDGFQPVGDFEQKDALLVASMVMELCLMQDAHQIPRLTEDLTEIDSL
jgi:hypothetical protein